MRRPGLSNPSTVLLTMPTFLEGVIPPLVKYCTLRSETRSDGPGGRFVVSEPSFVAPLVIASQVDVLPLKG